MGSTKACPVLPQKPFCLLFGLRRLRLGAIFLIGLTNLSDLFIQLVHSVYQIDHQIDAEIRLAALGLSHLTPIPVSAPGAGGFVCQRLHHNHLALNIAVLHSARSGKAIAHDVGALGQYRLALLIAELIPALHTLI